MTRDWLMQAPDGTMVRVEHIRPLLERLPDDDGPRYVTTQQASEREGRSARWWAEEARQGRIVGAHQVAPGAPWLLPAREARAHLLRSLNQGRQPNRRHRRGPRRKLQVVQGAS